MPSTADRFLSDASLEFLSNREVMVVPGLGGSGDDHWQTHWERRHPSWRRVEQEDWDHPVLEAWTGRLTREIASARRPVILVGHSLGVATIAHAAAVRGELDRVEAAFLVAMPDVERPDFPLDLCRGYAPLPGIALPFPSVMIGSRNDPWTSPEALRAHAGRLGSIYLDAGERHHIGTDSGLGAWEEGLGFFEDFLAGLRARHAPV